jgi:NADH-quinone oxidoreductase subunit G
MCDQGRLDYKFVDASDRLRTPMLAENGALVQSTWRDALTRASAAITELKARHGDGAMGAVVSPHLTVEENFCFGELMRAAGAGKLAMAVQRGAADDFLIKAEKAPNARGVRELGLVSGDDDGIGELMRALEAGALKGLYLCGKYPNDLLDLLDTLAPGRLAAILGRLELLIVQTLTLDPRVGGATVVFPTTTFAEKDGSFINHAGRVQRIYKAIETGPGWLRDGDIFTRLLNAIDGGERRFDAEAMWEPIGRTHPRFAGISLETLGASGTMLDGAGEQRPGDR